MVVSDLVLTLPKLRLEGRLQGLSTDTKPTVNADGTGTAVMIGTEYIETNTGRSYYFNGSTWTATTFPQKLDQGVEFQAEIYELLKKLVKIQGA